MPTLAKGVPPKAFPNHQKGIIEGAPWYFYVWLYLHKGKDTTKGTIKISAKLPHQTNQVLGDQEEGRTQTTPFT